MKDAAALVKNARYLVALTGAGVSTPSGIPDFRSPRSGLWENVDPFEVASLDTLRRRPAAFYQWLQPLVALMRAAKPNPAHLALAELERRGILKVLITQNVDSLHQAAGSQNVIELHGSFRSATCLKCLRIVSTAELMDQVIATGEVPRCSCGGVLKPDVVLMGEMLPPQAFHRAEQAARDCDLLLVAGTSLEIAPANNLPWLALQHGARLVMVNRSPTDLDSRATVLIRDDVATALPAILEAV